MQQTSRNVIYDTGESGGSEGGAERSGKVNLAAAVLLAALASPDAADQLH